MSTAPEPTPNTRARRRARCFAGSVALVATLLATDGVAGTGALAAAPAVSPTADSVIGLHYGSYGDSVRDLQRALIRVGVGVVGGVDGYFGSATRASVKAFQAYKGLTVTGVVNVATARALGLRAPASSAPSAPPSPSTGPLSQGATGERVRQLQRSLVNAGIHVPGGVDGVFGPGTASAVAAYQRSRGLLPTGNADSATLSALGRGAPAVGSGGLAQGATGEAVRQLQQALSSAGIHVPGGVDGVFGPATASAVRDYQRSRRLTVTGRADAATLNALARHAPAVTSPSSPPRPHRPHRSHRPHRNGVLARGATGDAVRELQAALIRAGITVPGGVDGVFGPATEGALKTYQRRVGLSATGRADAATMNRLILHNGSRGEAVKAVQRALMRAGITVPGGADGVFGPATEAALKTYQQRKGLPQTGRLDRATAAALAQERAHRPSPPSRPPTQSPNTAPGYPRFDEHGARVVALQQALMRFGVPLCGGADGVFGSCTANAVMQFQRSRGLSATGRVDQATANALGLRPMPAPSSPPAVSVSLQHVPIRPPCWYTDTWLAPRGDGRVHLGVDIIAARGQPEYAVANGVITLIYRDTPGSLSGNGLKLTRSDGTYFFYAHLERFARGIRVGRYVSAGQVVGYVGSTGNSATPHLHFEVHPGGGSAVNPTPVVRAAGTC
jgi:peptidoglycan hydrolase-like protein with peptidoglycan-binding domain